MKKVICLIMLLGLLTITSTAIADDSRYFWIDKDITVLTFIGIPSGLDLKLEKYTTNETQLIRLFHKRSGGRMYAFYLKGLIIKNQFGKRVTIRDNGYFLVQKSKVRKGQYKNKSSLKYKTFVVLYPPIW